MAFNPQAFNNQGFLTGVVAAVVAGIGYYLRKRRRRR